MRNFIEGKASRVKLARKGMSASAGRALSGIAGAFAGVEHPASPARRAVCLLTAAALVATMGFGAAFAANSSNSGSEALVVSDIPAQADEGAAAQNTAADGQAESVAVQSATGASDVSAFEGNASAVPTCACGENAPENLAHHADGCARKSHILSLIKNEHGGYKTAEQIYASWSSYDEATQADLLDMVKAYAETTYDDLLKLIEDGKSTVAGTVSVALEDLQEGFSELKAKGDVSREECERFYAEMMEAYSKAFDNDVPLVSEEQMKQIDDKFGKLQDALYDDFGYTQVQGLASQPSAQSNYRTTADPNGADGAVVADKNVSLGEDGISDFLLTLESYVTGTSMDYAIPVDLVLVLDQSASMYAPMGVSSGLNNSKLYTENSSNLARYALDFGSSAAAIGCLDLKGAFEDTTVDSTGLTFKEKVSQLGYLVAQSRSGGTSYCTEAHTKEGHTDGCKTYDWFVVQYVENDSEGKPWHLYRIKQTACPSNDSRNDGSYETDCVKYASFEEMGESHFYFYKSQTGALYDGILSFAKVLKDSGGDHRLAVAGFSGYDIEGYRVDGNKNLPGTCIYVGENKIAYNSTYKRQNSVYCSTITDDEYASALMDVQSNYDKILASLAAVKTDYYGTHQDVGFDMALNILKHATKVETDMEGYSREKAVVLFTDGEPSGPKTGDIVAKAKEVKNSGAKVYTICTSTLSADKREFLEASSSDYPDATGTYGEDSYTLGNRIESPQYAKTAENTEQLVQQFVSIAKDVGGANIELDEKAALVDEISQYFTLPEALIKSICENEQPSAETLENYIKAYTADCTGAGDDGFSFKEKQLFKDAKIEIVKGEDGRYSMVRVTNFDYSENFVSENGRGDNDDFHGKKLIVEIAIDTADGNLGGNKLPTNVGSSSGIYDGDKKIEQFPVPYVDVPTTVKVLKTVEGKNASTTEEFEFSANIFKLGSYAYDDLDKHYLKASTKDERSTFFLSHGNSEELEDVYVGSILVISEKENDLYETSIKVFDAKGQESNSLINKKDGSYSITVVPGMRIEYTNTYKLTDLTIEKAGVNENLDADGADKIQSTIFEVSNGVGFTMQVSIVGNGSVTIKDIPVGTYTVTELTDWSWRYELASISPTAKEGDAFATVEATADETAKATFENKRDNDKWLSGDCCCRNWWGKFVADSSSAGAN